MRAIPTEVLSYIHSRQEVGTLEVNTQGWSQDNHIVLAVSTGVDSMVLLHQLITQLKDSYAQLTCLHVNHNVREMAQEEEQFLKQYCDENKIPLHVKQLDLSPVSDKGNSIENEARIARYAWFDSMMESLNADVLLTAHHQDDQIETIFYRLMTGRSTRSSLGMAYVTMRHGYKLCRPLLTIEKAEIRDYQARYKIQFYEDETNSQNQYVRNDIRNRILPDINNNEHLDVAQLIKLKEWHDEQRKEIDREAEQFISHFLQKNTDLQKYSVPREQFLALRHSVRITVLDKVFDQLHVQPSFTEKTYNEWFQQLNSNLSQSRVYTTDKWIIHIAYDKFIIMANYDVSLSPTKIVQPGTYNYGHYHIDIKETISTIEYPLIIRTRKDGDKFVLNGVDGHKKVSRLLIDHKIEQHERDQLPIIINANDEIIAVGTLYLQNKYSQSIFIKDLGEE